MSEQEPMPAAEAAPQLGPMPAAQVPLPPARRFRVALRHFSAGPRAAEVLAADEDDAVRAFKESLPEFRQEFAQGRFDFTVTEIA